MFEKTLQQALEKKKKKKPDCVSTRLVLAELALLHRSLLACREKTLNLKQSRHWSRRAALAPPKDPMILLSTHPNTMNKYSTRHLCNIDLFYKIPSAPPNEITSDKQLTPASVPIVSGEQRADSNSEKNPELRSAARCDRVRSSGLCGRPASLPHREGCWARRRGVLGQEERAGPEREPPAAPDNDDGSHL